MAPPRLRHPEDIKAAVRKTGVSLAELARRSGKTPSSFNQALSRPMPVANQAIADHLGIPVHELWPDWYDERGNRRYQRGWTPTTAGRATQRQKGRAA